MAKSQYEMMRAIDRMLQKRFTKFCHIVELVIFTLY